MDPAEAVLGVAFVSAIAYTIVSVTKLIVGRRGAQKLADPAADARLERLEHAVDAIALEVERISEGQRFATKLLSEQARQKNAGEQLPSRTTT
jgi:hypothetical protein